MVIALEQARRMRGGAQSQLMRCSDSEYYVVKFQNNPQGIKTLANEMLAGRLAKVLGLPVPLVTVIEVDEDLIRFTDDLVIQLPCGRVKCMAGLQAGSQYVGSLLASQTYDLLPAVLFPRVSNVSDFCGMFAFDKWTCNTDGRQVVYVRDSTSTFRVVMIDNGLCFNGAEWNFPDTPLRSLYERSIVYRDVHGIESFDPWLTRIENLTKTALRDCASDIPSEWLDSQPVAFEHLIERLWSRRLKVRELIIAAILVSPRIFAAWQWETEKRSCSTINLHGFSPQTLEHSASGKSE